MEPAVQELRRAHEHASDIATEHVSAIWTTAETYESYCTVCLVSLLNKQNMHVWHNSFLSAQLLLYQHTLTTCLAIPVIN